MITIIVAVADNGVIGNANDMPWRSATDFAFFRQQTIGKPLIMGRRTFEAIGNALAKRRNIIITRNEGFDEPDTERAASLCDAIELAKDAPEIMIGGGGQIYREAIGIADRVLITRMHTSPDGDTIFPELDIAVWNCTVARREAPGPRDTHAMTFETWVRR